MLYQPLSIIPFQSLLEFLPYPLAMFCQHITIVQYFPFFPPFSWFSIPLRSIFLFPPLPVNPLKVGIRSPPITQPFHSIDSFLLLLPSSILQLFTHFFLQCVLDPFPPYLFAPLYPHRRHSPSRVGPRTVLYSDPADFAYLLNPDSNPWFHLVSSCDVRFRTVPHLPDLSLFAPSFHGVLLLIDFSLQSHGSPFSDGRTLPRRIPFPENYLSFSTVQLP